MEPWSESPLFWLKLALWFASNAFFSVYVKRAYSDPLALSTQHVLALSTQHILLGGAVAATMVWKGAVHVPRSQRVWTRGLLPSAALYVGGTICTNMSLSLMSVGFTHVIKACEPICTTGLLFFLRNSVPDGSALLAIASVAIGALISSISDLNFSALGVAAGLASNCCLQLRNILNHSLMATRLELAHGSCGSAEDARQLGAMELLLLTMLAACPMLIAIHAVALLVVPASSLLLSLSPSPASTISAMCFLIYQTFSILVLSHVGPIAHAGVQQTSNHSNPLPLRITTTLSSPCRPVPSAHTYSELRLHTFPLADARTLPRSLELAQTRCYHWCRHLSAARDCFQHLAYRHVHNSRRRNGLLAESTAEECGIAKCAFGQPCRPHLLRCCGTHQRTTTSVGDAAMP